MAFNKYLYVLHIDDVEVDMGCSKIYAEIEAAKVARDFPNMDVWIERKQIRDRKHRDKSEVHMAGRDVV